MGQGDNFILAAYRVTIESYSLFLTRFYYELEFFASFKNSKFQNFGVWPMLTKPQKSHGSITLGSGTYTAKMFLTSRATIWQKIV